VFQEDFFELDPDALSNDIFIWHAAKSNSYQPLDIFELSISQGGSKEYLYIFESMLRIFTMLAHREQSICHSDPSHPDGLCTSLVYTNQTVVQKALRMDPDSPDILPRHPCFTYLGSADTLKPVAMTTTYKYTNHKHLHFKKQNIIFNLYLQQSQVS